MFLIVLVGLITSAQFSHLDHFSGNPCDYCVRYCFKEEVSILGSRKRNNQLLATFLKDPITSLRKPCQFWHNKRLEVHNVPGGELTANFVTDNCVESLEIYSHEIRSINEYALASVPNLLSLRFYISRLNRNDIFNFGYHSNLNEFTIEMIGSVNDDNSSQVVDVPERIPFLDRISVRRINMTCITRSWISKLPSLDWLDVSENPISDIENFFKNLPPKLDNLIINNAGLTKLGGWPYPWLKNIVHLQLNRNHFKRVINRMKYTREGDLNLFYPDYKTLLILTLQECGIEVIENNAFQRIYGLEMLDLSMNRIIFLPEFLLRHSPYNLWYLNLDENPLQNLLNFSSFVNLKCLYLNRIGNPYLFASSHTTIWKLDNLETLFITGNYLETFPEGMFDQMPELRELNIINNNFKELNIGTLPRLKWLTIGNLANTTFEMLILHANANVEQLCVRKVPQICKGEIINFCLSGFKKYNDTSIYHYFDVDEYGQRIYDVKMCNEQKICLFVIKSTR